MGLNRVSIIKSFQGMHPRKMKPLVGVGVTVRLERGMRSEVENWIQAIGGSVSVATGYDSTFLVFENAHQAKMFILYWYDYFREDE